MAGLLGDGGECCGGSLVSLLLFIFFTTRSRRGKGNGKGEHTLISVILRLRSTLSSGGGTTSSGRGTLSGCGAGRLVLELAGGFLEEVHCCGGVGCCC